MGSCKRSVWVNFKSDKHYDYPNPIELRIDFRALLVKSDCPNFLASQRYTFTAILLLLLFYFHAQADKRINKGDQIGSLVVSI